MISILNSSVSLLSIVGTATLIGVPLGSFIAYMLSSEEKRGRAKREKYKAKIVSYQQDKIRSLYNQGVQNNSNQNKSNKKAGVYWHFNSSIIKKSYMISRYGFDGMPPDLGQNVNFTMEQARSLQFWIILSHESSDERSILTHYEIYDSQSKKILNSEYEIKLKKGNDRIFFNIIIHQPGLYRLTATLNNSYSCEYYFGVLNPYYVEAQKKIYQQNLDKTAKEKLKPKVFTIPGFICGLACVLLFYTAYQMDNGLFILGALLLNMISCIFHMKSHGFFKGIGVNLLMLLITAPIGVVLGYIISQIWELIVLAALIAVFKWYTDGETLIGELDSEPTPDSISISNNNGTSTHLYKKGTNSYYDPNNFSDHYEIDPNKSGYLTSVNDDTGDYENNIKYH